MPSRCLLVLGMLAGIVPAEVVKTPVWVDGPATHLEATVNGEPVPIRSVVPAESDLILLLVLDTVKFPDRTDAAHEAIASVAESLGRNCLVGVLSAMDGLAVRLDPTRNRKRLRETLGAVGLRGVPGLLEVVPQVSEVADATLRAADVRVAALFVTDGEIEDYRGDYTVPVVNPSDQRDLSRRFGSQLIQQRIRAVVDSLAAAQAPLFFLHLARQYDSQNEVYQNGIAEFALTTGGRAVFARGVQEIPELVRGLLSEIAAHSVVAVETDCGGRRRLEVRGNGVAARHRETLACPPEGT